MRGRILFEALSSCVQWLICLFSWCVFGRYWFYILFCYWFVQSDLYCFNFKCAIFFVTKLVTLIQSKRLLWTGWVKFPDNLYYMIMLLNLVIFTHNWSHPGLITLNMSSNYLDIRPLCNRVGHESTMTCIVLVTTAPTFLTVYMISRGCGNK